ncbi:SUMF1/EgtB/PvdO family nonheme iron enzyme [Rothia sp. LK2588]|uniref:formylglycine-generating enzyme family protein n=1 Tax=Rothia sp. LK2588 TaxID=3114369 RepID=UPI0034CECD96
MDRRTLLTASTATLGVLALGQPAFASAPAGVGNATAEAHRMHKPMPAINELNRIFKEAEAVTQWPKGYYRDVYTRILKASQKLIDTTSAQINPQLALDAGILNRQAQAMLNEESQFEQEKRPAQLENRYTRVDMQLWRDRLAFDLKNPYNEQKATAGVTAVAQSAPAANKPLETYSDNAGSFRVNYKVIPAGTFEMGGDQAEWERHNVDDYRRVWESPKHPVTIRRNFGIMPTEVTRDMFAAFVAETGYAMPAGGVGFPAPPQSQDPNSSMYRPGVTWQNPGIPQNSGSEPVVQVSRVDAKAFARWLSAKTGQNWRLPSEAEWEYAARAGTTTAYYWGEDINDGNEYAAGYDVRTDAATGYGFKPMMETDDGAAYTAPVASYKPNAWGLYDMTGNAREWVADYWEPNLESGPYTEQARTSGVEEFPVLRGGAWDYMPQNLRIAYRSAYYNNYIHSNMWGFRLVRDI